MTPRPRVRFRLLLGGTVGLLVAVLLLLFLHRHQRALGIAREGAAAERAVAALGAELREAEARAFAIGADLRFLLSTTPEAAPGPYANAAREVERNRAALAGAVDRYARRETETRVAPEVDAAGQVALAEARGALAGLDSLAARVRAGDRTVGGSVGYAVQAVAVPLRRLVDTSRYHADLVRRRTDDRLAAARRDTWLLLAAALLLSAALVAMLARSFERRCASLTASARVLAEGGLDAPSPDEGDELDAVRRELGRIRAALRERDAEARAQQQALDAVRERAAEAERASELKTRFIGHVSHEFRTPLSSIIGFGSLLAQDRGGLGEERRAEYLGIVLRNARHLLHIVNDILNLSKVEAGTLEVTLAPLAAGEVAAAVVTSLGPAAQDRGIRLTLDDRARHLAVADAGRLRQVLLNLLDNAIKYSPPGSPIEVSVESTPGEVRVEVRDRGPGIGPEDRSRLFKEFSRITRGTARVAGAGLGLALAKRLTEAMGGRIGVDSQPGQGSVFWVTLRAGDELAPARETAGGRAEPAAAARRGTVAVVDDDPDIRAYAAAVLESVGYGALADDGVRGVAERLAAARPAAVFLDLNLGPRSGVDVLREIRAQPALARTPVIAFTAAGTAADLEHVRTAGFDGFLVKPVEPDAFLARVDAAVAASRRGEVPDLSPAEPSADRTEAPSSPSASSSEVADSPVDPGDDEDDYLAPLRRKFQAGLADRLREMERLAAAGDADGLAREAHKLKGAAAGYGFADLSALAAGAEEALRAGGPVSHPAVGTLLERLRAGEWSVL